MKESTKLFILIGIGVFILGVIVYKCYGNNNNSLSKLEERLLQDEDIIEDIENQLQAQKEREILSYLRELDNDELDDDIEEDEDNIEDIENQLRAQQYIINQEAREVLPYLRELDNDELVDNDPLLDDDELDDTDLEKKILQNLYQTKSLLNNLSSRHYRQRM